MSENLRLEGNLEEKSDWLIDAIRYYLEKNLPSETEEEVRGWISELKQRVKRAGMSGKIYDREKGEFVFTGGSETEIAVELNDWQKKVLNKGIKKFLKTQDEAFYGEKEEFLERILNELQDKEKRKSIEEAESLEDLRGLEPYEFEKVVASVWENLGWKTEVTSESSDKGIDVVAEKNNPYNQKVLIQAKKFSEENKIGSEQIQQYASLKRQESNVDQVVIVTTGFFTDQAEETGFESGC